MEDTLANALGALAGVVGGLILTGAARARSQHKAQVPVRVEQSTQPLRKRRRPRSRHGAS